MGLILLELTQLLLELDMDLLAPFDLSLSLGDFSFGHLDSGCELGDLVHFLEQLVGLLPLLGPINLQSLYLQ